MWLFYKISWNYIDGCWKIIIDFIIRLTNKEKKTDTIIQTTLPLNFDEKKSEVEEEVKNIDILNITPIEAINILSKLKEKVK